MNEPQERQISMLAGTHEDDWMILDATIRIEGDQLELHADDDGILVMQVLITDVDGEEDIELEEYCGLELDEGQHIRIGPGLLCFGTDVTEVQIIWTGSNLIDVQDGSLVLSHCVDTVGETVSLH